MDEPFSVVVFLARKAVGSKKAKEGRRMCVAAATVPKCRTKILTAPSKRSRWFSPGATLCSQLQRIPRAARSGNAATLFTLPTERRHAAPARLTASQRHSNAQGTHRAHRLMRTQRALKVGASIKRAVITFLLGIWRGHRAVLIGVVVAHVKRGRRGDALHRALSRPIFMYGKPCGVQRCCSAIWARNVQLCLPVRVYGLLCLVRI